ncbi:hypothetical protein [Pseudomonas putida]
MWDIIDSQSPREIVRHIAKKLDS